jgi:O-antigen/teichoic acid export membrane protein
MTRVGVPPDGLGRRPSDGRSPGAGAWARHRDVLHTAATLVASTAVTSVLGLVFWAVAARLFTREAVGYGSAAVSAITLAGTIGMLGLGTVLIGELPRRHGSRGGLVMAALVAAAAVSAVLGLGFAVLSPLLAGELGRLTGSVPAVALFVAGAALTGAALVFDQATIGLLRGGLQLWRNVAFSVLKLLALVVAPLLVNHRYGLAITAAWVAGTALSLVATTWLVRRTGRSLWHRPDWAVLRGLGGRTLEHSWLNLAFQLPRLLVPVLVTVLVSASANGAFYVVWMLAGVFYLVPTHLATALFAATSADPPAMRDKVRLTLRVSGVVGLAGALVLGVGAPAVLAVFGPEYAAEGTLPLRLLVLAYAPMVVKVHYVGVCRATDRVPRAALVLSASAALEIAGTVAGADVAGLVGVCLALLVCYAVEAVPTAPLVWAARKSSLLNGGVFPV